MYKEIQVLRTRHSMIMTTEQPASQITTWLPRDAAHESARGKRPRKEQVRKVFPDQTSTNATKSKVTTTKPKSAVTKLKAKPRGVAVLKNSSLEASSLTDSPPTPTNPTGPTSSFTRSKNRPPEEDEPIESVVHFIRHATAPKTSEGEEWDPKFTKEGRAQCAKFSKDFTPHEKYITNIFSSPLTRCVGTPCLVLKSVLDADENSSVVLMQELQSMGSTPGSTGPTLTMLRRMYDGKEHNEDDEKDRVMEEGFDEFMGVVDTYMVSRDYSEVLEGRWIAKHVEWRIDNLKFYFTEICEEMRSSRNSPPVEIAIVSNSSFLDSLLG
ncbi:uncharacterized protein PAC_19086 [Phialocephala subalpina]|uniref:Phosphoglycerate mutase family protein n=1 Tax=Phialocephala subalpina TaxID=576137 RepID=A0A1L7XVY3_9HELO|nr:uncharacterized protein PAC_19086 [Phialocephala subalpina]